MLNDRRGAAEQAERRAEYERRYGRYGGAVQPRLAGTKLHVEIYPGERATAVRGRYRLVNRSGVPIDSIHLATASEVETGAVDFGRPARPVLVDDDLGHRIYALGEPLYLRKHRIRSGEQTITVTVPRPPARAGLDPYHVLIDRKRGDNVREVRPGGGEGGKVRG